MHIAIQTTSPPASARQRQNKVLAGRILFGLAIAAVWQWAGTSTGLAAWISNPAAIAVQLSTWLADGTVATHLTVTLTEILFGLCLGAPAGILLGFALSASALVRTMMMPWLTALYTIPLVAIAPLLILWMGVGITSKIFLVMIMTTFILTWSTFSGARTVSPALIRQMRLLGASRTELFSRCIFWASLPFILTGLRTAIPYSLTGAVAGEMIATKSGIGFLIMTSAQRVNMTQMYSVLVLLMMSGMALVFLADMLERLTPRSRSLADDVLIG